MIPNIGPRGQRQRLTLGVIATTGAAVLAVALLLLDAPRTWRLACFLPLWIGALGFFQAFDKT